jgi:hypothetical protein
VIHRVADGIGRERLRQRTGALAKQLADLPG